MTWTSISALAVIALLFAFENFVSNKTKAYISSLIPAVIIFIVLMYTGIIPPNICTAAGLNRNAGSVCNSTLCSRRGNKAKH